MTHTHTHSMTHKQTSVTNWDMFWSLEATRESFTLLFWTYHVLCAYFCCPCASDLTSYFRGKTVSGQPASRPFCPGQRVWLSSWDLPSWVESLRSPQRLPSLTSRPSRECQKTFCWLLQAARDYFSLLFWAYHVLCVYLCCPCTWDLTSCL